MRYKDVIYLLTTETFVDELGQTRETENDIPRMVYANERGISSSEFYSAAQHGYKPERQFEIYAFDYNGESKLTHEGKEYRIIRTEKISEKVRISCGEVIGNG